jgi:hypothetical protein
MHDKFLDQAIQTKEDKYNPLVDAIRAQGWNIRPLVVITAGLTGAIHAKNIKSLTTYVSPHHNYKIL